MSTQTQWEILSKAAVRICADPKRKPHQWIYLVDDAWFHPFPEEEYKKAKAEYENGSNGDKPFYPAVFKDEHHGNTLKWDTTIKTLLEAAAKERVASNSKGKTDEEQQEVQVDESGKAEGGINDAEIAELFCKLAAEKNYGVCCCSFEYFWEHYEPGINSALNAVFFDINHALLRLEACSDLKEAWEKKFEDVKLTDKTITTEPLLHGWLVHYAIKLGLLGGAPTQIRRDHILLISSNFSSKGISSSGDAASQFQTVFQSIWKSSMNNVGIQLHEDIGLSSFGYTPFLKDREGRDLVSKAFECFSKTFSRMSDWKNIRTALFRDLVLASCDAHNPCNIRKEALYIKIWSECEDLRGIYHCISKKEPISEASLIRYLDLVLPVVGCKWNCPTLDGTMFQVSTAIRPGIAALITITDLIAALSLKWNEKNRPQPEVTYTCKKNGAPATLSIKISQAGITTLSEHLKNASDNDGDPTKSRNAVRRMRNKEVLRLICNDYKHEPALNVQNIPEIPENWMILKGDSITITFQDPDKDQGA